MTRRVPSFLIAALFPATLVCCGPEDESNGNSAAGAGGRAQSGGTGGSAATGGAQASGGTDGSGGSAASGGQAGSGVTCDDEQILIQSTGEFSDFLELGCTTVSGHFRITDSDLTSLDGLAISSVGGDLHLAANADLTNLGSLASVEQVGEDLVIAGNETLTTLSALMGWSADTVAGSLAIFANAALPQCEVDDFDALLDANCDNCRNNGTGTCQ